MTDFGAGFFGGGVQSVQLTMQPADLINLNTIQILPAVPGKQYYVLGCMFELGAGTVNWTSTRIGLMLGVGDFYFFIHNNALTNQGQFSHAGTPDAFNTNNAIDLRNKALNFDTGGVFGPVNGNRPITVTAFYQLY